MATNYFIGIGGTGARTAEALVHLCGAGYGPDDLTIFLVDPDEGNGNLNRTKAAINGYQNAYAGFNERPERTDLLGTSLDAPDPLNWSIFKRRDVRLADHIGYQNLKSTQRDLADFANVLFSEEELDERLDEGFRGHPSIGATVMSDPDADADPWRTFWNDVENAGQPGEVRVFLAGSIFGGTGAAGIPTLGAPDMIKGDPKADIGEGSKVHLGAALVLPYFTFESGDHDRLFVTSSDFPIATKAALQFYDEKELAFDEMYFVGDSLGQQVGEFSPGSRSQENRPHYIELTTALAAQDFFEQAGDGSGEGDQYFTAGRASRAVDWNALPVSRHPGAVQSRRNALKRTIVTTTAFSYAFLEYGLPILERSPDDVLDSWHRDHFHDGSWFGSGEAVDPRQPQQKQQLERVGRYAWQFLEWITALDEGEDGAVQLVDGSKLVNAQNGALSLRDHERYEHDIGSFLRESSSERDFNALLNELNDVQITSKSMSPSDKFVNLFYEAARRFCQKNYEIA